MKTGQTHVLELASGQERSTDKLKQVKSVKMLENVINWLSMDENGSNARIRACKWSRTFDRQVKTSEKREKTRKRVKMLENVINWLSMDENGSNEAT
jgi:hypothetical protein